MAILDTKNVIEVNSRKILEYDIYTPDELKKERIVLYTDIIEKIYEPMFRIYINGESPFTYNPVFKMMLLSGDNNKSGSNEIIVFGKYNISSTNPDVKFSIDFEKISEILYGFDEPMYNLKFILIMDYDTYSLGRGSIVKDTDVVDDFITLKTNIDDNTVSKKSILITTGDIIVSDKLKEYRDLVV